MGAALLHLLPEALEEFTTNMPYYYLLFGFVVFFILERYFHWRHCHDGVCSIHAFTYLNLIGDGIHNFVDGLVIGASFLVSIKFGIVTTLVIILHEIPQEIGDFGVLIYGGMTKIKALMFNFLSALTCVIGTVCGYFIATQAQNFSPGLLAFTAGGFIYIAACDLIPELHKQPDIKKSALSMVFFILGIAFILISKTHAH